MTRPTIRPLKTLNEFREGERLQREIWGTISASSELLSVTPKCGGVLLGAFAGKKMVGFLFAFLGRRRGRLIHWSQMMAVREGYRDLGLGFKMKLAHRQLALAQGIKSICWTYDPLQSRNASLNIARLGASVEEYVVDYYGRFPSVIEKGLASDRFVANWHIASPRVARRLREGPPPLDIRGLARVNETRLGAGGLPLNVKLRLRLQYPRLLVEIPTDTDAMRAASLGLAKRWRMETRKIFQAYFRAGYRVEDFVPPRPATADRCFYLLRR